MGFLDNRKISKLKEKYTTAIEKGKGSKAFEHLENLFELGYKPAGEMLARGYYYGLFFCFDTSLHKSTLTITPDFSKARLYFEKLLSIHGNKAKATWDQIEDMDNYYIGWYKAHLAMTYLDTDNKKYLDIMLDAALKNRCPMALAKCAIVYETDYEKFDLEQDLVKTIALYIASHKSYSTNHFLSNYFTELDVSENYVWKKIESYQDQSAMAKVYCQERMQYFRQRYSQMQSEMLAIEFARASMLNELDDKIDWYDKTTGERIPDINKVLKNMENILKQMDK